MAIAIALAILPSVAGARRAPGPLRVGSGTNEGVTLAARGAVVAAAWSVTGDPAGAQIVAAVSHDGGGTFAAPVRVASAASVNGEQPPRVALVRTARGTVDVVVVWAGKTSAGSRLLSARSSDGGRSFGRPALVPGTEAAGNRGWHSVAVDGQGRVIVFWLDHRDGAATAGATHHHHATTPAAPRTPDESVERAAASRLYVGSVDGSLPAQGLTHGVCYCCKTAAAVGPDGRVFTAWRHVFAGSHRDIAFSASSDGGRMFSTPARVSRDSWQLDGCPENGPALAVDTAGAAHVVWPTLVAGDGGESLALFHAATTDGRRFTSRVRVPATSAAYHPQAVVLPSGDLVVAWDEGSDGTRQIRWTRGRPDASGRMRFEPSRTVTDGEGVYPALAVVDGDAVLAWTTRAGAGGIRIARLEAAAR